MQNRITAQQTDACCVRSWRHGRISARIQYYIVTLNKYQITVPSYQVYRLAFYYRFYSIPDTYTLWAVLIKQLFFPNFLFFFQEKQETFPKLNISKVWKFNRGQNIWKASHSNFWGKKIGKYGNTEIARKKNLEIWTKSPSIRTAHVTVLPHQRSLTLTMIVISYSTPPLSEL